ncbi:protein TIFY 5A-like [Apium graveolens]|uniref:protein TIFY 5A-like n=1 Tax=Apium graveolens TaxID=4045 RepID=UPI003D7BDB0A
MRRNCNLELQLVTPSCDDHTVNGQYIFQRQPLIEEVTYGNPRQEQNTRKITIFYNGRVKSCDVTEIQARSIISVASEEIGREKGEAKTPTCSETSSDSCPKAQVMHKQQNTGLTMKRSLQQFLQKRRTRIHATSPYCIP